MFQRQFYDVIKSIVSYVGLRAFAVAVLRGTDYLCIHCVLYYCCCLLLLNLLECLSYNICLISPSYVMKNFFSLTDRLHYKKFWAGYVAVRLRQPLVWKFPASALCNFFSIARCRGNLCLSWLAAFVQLITSAGCER